MGYLAMGTGPGTCLTVSPEMVTWKSHRSIVRRDGEILCNLGRDSLEFWGGSCALEIVKEPVEGFLVGIVVGLPLAEVRNVELANCAGRIFANVGEIHANPPPCAAFG